MRMQDVALGAWGGEVEQLGNIKDLLTGADLSPVEAIWDKVKEAIGTAGDRSGQARELRERLSKHERRLKRRR